MKRSGLVPLAPVLVVLAACSEGVDPAGLADPASCEGCHPDQVREWAGSMHAYAADAPVFLAMNRLGQRETGGALGDFCVRCHAPFADGRDVESLPRAERGVTCVACHQIEEVVALHNGGLRWSRDRTMRGGLGDPVETSAHDSAYSPLVAAAALESSAACGACHDVVSPAGVAVERTYAEWSESIFARHDVGLSCATCHMPGRDAPAAFGGPTRRVHDHRLPGVDVALTPWPDVDVQRALIARDLKGAVAARLCAIPTGGGVRFDVTLENVQAGHAFPSGVTHARRAWLHLVAEEAGVVTREVGGYATDEVVPLDDPAGWVLGSRFVGEGGVEVSHAWEATGIESALLPPAVTLDPQDPAFNHSVTRSFFVAGAPDGALIVVKLQPVGLELLDRLVAAGELDPAVRAAMPVHELAGTETAWLRARDGWGCAP